MNAKEQARDFVLHETQFHLGFLPTEQSNPKSATLESDFKSDPVRGVATLQAVDRDILPMAKRIFASAEFALLRKTMIATVRGGGRILFSGCGATGRLSILLESMWRQACREKNAPELADCVGSIMTGGDFALVRSVEFFEDYTRFGHRQAADWKLTPRDMLVGITEGGETSSVIGSCEEAAERGAAVFLMFNNPAECLVEHLERSRRIITDPRVVVLDLFCGPMALAGSTRMQATSSEQLVAGAALEQTFAELRELPQYDCLSAFETLLNRLEEPGNRKILADVIDFESRTYARSGKITYFADDYLLDVFTDTTERSPTFMLPPFRRRDDAGAPVSWAFVKDPLFSTPETWARQFCRKPRCLIWTADDYAAMGAANSITSRIPQIGETDFLQFEIGNEPAPERSGSDGDAAVLVVRGEESRLRQAFAAAAKPFARKQTLCVGRGTGDWILDLVPQLGGASPLRLIDHMAIKLVFNTVSTGTMVVLGRVSGNWMSWVDLSNKKLIDRGARLIAELGRIPYPEACERLFEAKEEAARTVGARGERVCAVQLALKKLNARSESAPSA